MTQRSPIDPTPDDVLQRLDAALDRAPHEAATEHDAVLARDAVLESDPDLHREARALENLFAALERDRIEVRDGFTESVRARVDAVRSRRGSTAESRAAAWRLPLVACLVFALGGALLLAGSSSVGGGVLGGTGAALADFAQSTLLAGAGLLGASWRGVGFGLAELFAASTSTLVAAAIGVLCLDLLFLSLLRRRRATETAAERAPDYFDESGV